MEQSVTGYPQKYAKRLKHLFNRYKTRLTHLGLQRRIQLLATVGLLAIFALFWLASEWAVEKNIQQSLDYQLTIANLLASSLDERLNAVLTLLETTAAHPELDQNNSVDAYAPLLQETQLRLSLYGHRLFWLSSNGDILWTAPFDASLLGTPFPHFAAVRPALEKGMHHVAKQCSPLESSQPEVLMAAPVFQSTGEVDSLLVEALRIDQLSLAKLLEQVTPDSGAQIDIVDQEGNMLVSCSSAHDFENEIPAERFAGLIDKQEPLVGTCHQCHPAQDSKNIERSDEVFTFAPLNVVPWGIAIRQPASEVMAPINRLRQQLLLGGGAVLIVALLLTSWFIERQVVTPIRALDEASAQMASGNLSVPIPKSGADEVARLTANLEQMRSKLETTLEDHRRWNETLEEMVEDRTRELTLLYEQLEGKAAMCKQLLGKALTAQEEERTRLARELHDAIGQSLTAVIMATASVERNLPPDLQRPRKKLTKVREIAGQALKDLRNLIFNLRPEILDDLGLSLALRSQTKEHLEAAGIQVQFETSSLKKRLSPEVETVIFRVVQEAITNIARHAQATKVHISLLQQNNRLIVRIEDNGVGFDPDQILNGNQQAWGLRGMEERVALLGGEFHINAKADSGTLVQAEIPLEQNI